MCRPRRSRQPRTSSRRTSGSFSRPEWGSLPRAGQSRQRRGAEKWLLVWSCVYGVALLLECLYASIAVHYVFEYIAICKSMCAWYKMLQINVYMHVYTNTTHKDNRHMLFVSCLEKCTHHVHWKAEYCICDKLLTILGNTGIYSVRTEGCFTGCEHRHVKIAHALDPENEALVR